MNPNKLFPLVVVDDLEPTRKAYAAMGFDVSIDMPQYVQFRYGSDERGPEIAFMVGDGAEAPPRFEGDGLIVSVPTENADAAHKRYAKAQVDVLGEPEDRPWGWRSFRVRDPNGVVLDFFHVMQDA